MNLHGMRYKAEINYPLTIVVQTNNKSINDIFPTSPTIYKLLQN